MQIGHRILIKLLLLDLHTLDLKSLSYTQGMVVKGQLKNFDFFYS